MKIYGRRLTNRLSAASIKAKPGPKIQDRRDGNGLILRTHPNGRKQWIWRGTVRGTGKETMFGLGSPDVVTLAEARAMAIDYTRRARQGRDPRNSRVTSITFLEAARRKHAEIAPTFKNAKASAQWIGRIERICGPVFGRRPIVEVTTGEIRSALLPVWSTTQEAALRTRQAIERVFDWAIASSLRDDNPATLARLALPAQIRTEKHHPSLSYSELPSFLVRLRGSSAELEIRLCLEFLITTATRSNEARGANWEEIDFDQSTWTVPGGWNGRMKGRGNNPPDHVVPLSEAALAVLARATALNPNKAGLIFPNLKKRRQKLSENAFAGVIKALGLKGKATPHGMRASFKTWAGHQGANESAVAEFCLAHQVESKVERAYMRGTMFESRKDLLQRWSDFLTLNDNA